MSDRSAIPAEAWFILYPPVGGGRGTYPGLRARLGGQLRQCSLAGRDDRFAEPAFSDFVELADDLWSQLLAELDSGCRAEDLVLFGFSMGALLAAEMAQRLETRGSSARALVVAGCAPPQVLRGRRLTGLDDGEFIEALAAHSSTPEIMRDQQLVRLMMPIWRADCAVVESHPRLPPLLSCPVIAVGGRSDDLTPAADLALWERVGGPGSRAYTVAGGHGELLLAEDVLMSALAEGARLSAGVAS